MYARYMSRSGQAGRRRPDPPRRFLRGDGRACEGSFEWLNLTLTSRTWGFRNACRCAVFLPRHGTVSASHSRTPRRICLGAGRRAIYILSRAELSESESRKRQPFRKIEQPFDESELSELQEILSSELADGQAAERPVLAEIEDDEPNPFDEQNPKRSQTKRIGKKRLPSLFRKK